MIIRGCKTTAEYAVRKWMDSNGFVRGNFELTMDGNDAMITDRSGGSPERCPPARGLRRTNVKSDALASDL